MEHTLCCRRNGSDVEQIGISLSLIPVLPSSVL